MLYKRIAAIIMVCVFGALEANTALSDEAANTTQSDESTIKLREVVVTATRTELEPQDVPQTVTVVTAEDIQKSGAQTAAEAIERTTGVQIQDLGPMGSLTSVSIRGSTFQQVQVLLDGVRLNSASLGGYDLSDLPVPLNDIERIEILRGPSSALYGADAVGGVVNIITKKPKAPQTTVSGEGGSYGYWSLNLKNENKLDNFYYSLYVGKEKSDGYRLNSALDNTITGAKLGYNLTPDSSLDFSANYIEKQIGVPGSVMFPSPLATEWDRNYGLSLTYTSKLSKDLDLKLNAYQNRYKDIFIDLNPAFPQNSTNISTSSEVGMQVNWVLNSWNLLTGGLEVQGDHIESTSTGEHTASTWGTYLQDEISIGNSLLVVLGGRNDDHSAYGDKFTPRASARYLVARTGTIIRASAGEAYRAPTLNDLYWGFDGFEVGNPNLKPETSTEYEGGIEQPFGVGNMVKGTIFERKVSNLIVWTPNAAFIYSPQNIDSVEITGYEAEAKFTFFSRLVWATNYTYMDPVDEITGQRIYNTIPEYQLKSSLNLSLHSKTNISLEGLKVRNYVQAGDPTAPSSHYEVVSWKISQDVAIGRTVKGQVYVGEKNVFDHRYEVVGGYPMPPQQFYGGISIVF